MSLVLPEASARALLEEFHPTFAAIVDTGWSRYHDIPPDFRSVFSLRTQANVVWDFMTRTAEKLLKPHPRVTHFSLTEHTCLAIIDDGIAIRFKKVDDQGVGAGYSTPTQLDFCAQRPVPGMAAELPRITVGYTLTPSKSSYDRILISLPKNITTTAWRYEIEVAPVVTRAPVPAIAEEETVRTSVGLKGAEDRSAAGNDS